MATAEMKYPVDKWLDELVQVQPDFAHKICNILRHGNPAQIEEARKHITPARQLRRDYNGETLLHRVAVCGLLHKIADLVTDEALNVEDQRWPEAAVLAWSSVV